MTTIRMLTAADVGELLEPDEVRARLEQAMDALSAGRASVPPRVAAVAPSGWLAAMPGYLDGVGLAAKLVSIFPGNVETPSHQGVIALFDPDSGSLISLMDAEVITEARTAMTAAVAADLLSRSDAAVLTIVGGGAQARAHARAFVPLRSWREVRVFNRTPARAELVAGVARDAGAASVLVSDDIGGAVAGADVIALCTHAESAVIDAALVGPGCHVSSVGSTPELPEVLADADVVVVEWRDSVVVAPPAGAAEIQSLRPDQVVELGDLIAGRAEGRVNSTQITVYKSTGHAVQDIAAACLVYQRAVAAGIGQLVDL